MTRSHDEELTRNFDAFRRSLASFIHEQRGRIALMRDARVEGFYDRAFDALAAGEARYPDGLFSIQEVVEDAVDLGYWSHAVDQR